MLCRPIEDGMLPEAGGPIPIGYGQTISQPSLVLFMTQQLNIAQTDIVLEIGTGSGYQTAMLAKVANEVYSIERVEPLLELQKKNSLYLVLRIFTIY